MGKRKYTEIRARMTPEEKEIIEERMKAVGVTNYSGYMRKMAIDGYIINVDMSDLKEILRLLRINSNNLNQYAKRANENGSIYQSDIVKLQQMHRELLDKTGEVLRRLSSLS